MSRPLAGIRVLDLTNVLAGPFACYQLAALGAEVIKVEVPGTGDLARQLGADPELNRRLMGVSFLAQNAGKRSITVNLKAPAGKELFRRLVATADAVVENFRPGVMDRLGLGYDELCRVKPDIVYCAISGFGMDGPLRDNPAYDQIVQGLSGVMSVTGTPETAPLRVGGKYAIKHTTRSARAVIRDVQYRLDINSLHRDEAAEGLRLNEIGRVRMRTTVPLLADEYRRNRTTGGFIIIDETTNRTVGAGMIVEASGH